MKLKQISIEIVGDFVKAAVKELANHPDIIPANNLLQPEEERFQDVLGRLLAHVTEWDGDAIIQVAQTAMEDSNFGGEVQYFEEGSPIEVGPGITANAVMFPREEV